MGDGCEEEMVKKDKWTLFEGPDLLRGELWPSCLTFWPDTAVSHNAREEGIAYYTQCTITSHDGALARVEQSGECRGRFLRAQYQML